MKTQLSQQELQQVYSWVDQIPLSKQKKHISRDFADGVLMAQILFKYNSSVQLHNYPSCNSYQKKKTNWYTLNKKVLKPMKMDLNKMIIQDLVQCVPMTIQRVLLYVKNKLQQEQKYGKQSPNQMTTNMQRSSIQDKRNLKSALFEKHKKQKLNQIEQLKQITDILREKISWMQTMVDQKNNRIKELQDLLSQKR